MKLLLDTHIWLWSMLEPGRIHGRVARALRKTGNELWLSPLSIWESVLLVEQRKVRVDRGVEDWICEAMKAASIREASFSAEIALAAREFWPGQRDPVNVLLAATAKVYGLTLVTADARLLKIRGIATLANR